MKRRGAPVAALVLLAVVGGTLADASPARAIEREHHLGLDLGGAALVIKDKSTTSIGATLGAHYTYGLSDAFNLMAEGAFSLVALDQNLDTKKTPRTFPATVSNLDVGLGYVFDVLRWVPYAGVLLGGYALGGGTIEGTKLLPGVAAALGVDYRLTPSLSVGLAAREHFIWPAGTFGLTSETVTYPTFTEVTARVEYVWGW